jgi:hypothetical protein
MNPSQTMEALNCAYEADVPVMLWGPVGGGKSDVVDQSRKAQGPDWGLIDCRLSQFDSVDLRGVPSVALNRTCWNIPDIFPDAETQPFGVLFLDEINAAPQAVMAAAYQLILDRKVGDYELPPGWRIVAAGNRASDRAITNKMGSAVMNRMIHLDFEPELDDWVNWANKHHIRPEIISFIQFRPEFLHNHDPLSKDRAFATPRTWEYASRVLNAATPRMEYPLLSATIGDGVASEFMSYIRIYRDLPSIEQIEKKPEDTPIPKEPATKLATASMLAEHLTVKNVPLVNKYLLRLPKDFQVPTVKMAVQRNPDLIETKEILDWITDNEDILL